MTEIFLGFMIHSCVNKVDYPWFKSESAEHFELFFAKLQYLKLCLIFFMYFSSSFFSFGDENMPADSKHILKDWEWKTWQWYIIYIQTHNERLEHDDHDYDEHDDHDDDVQLLLTSQANTRHCVPYDVIDDKSFLVNDLELSCTKLNYLEQCWERSLTQYCHSRRVKMSGKERRHQVYMRKSPAYGPVLSCWWHCCHK